MNEHDSPAALLERPALPPGPGWACQHPWCRAMLAWFRPLEPTVVVCRHERLVLQRPVFPRAAA
jgi:hypothetical protein